MERLRCRCRAVRESALVLKVGEAERFFFSFSVSRVVVGVLQYQAVGATLSVHTPPS